MTVSELIKHLETANPTDLVCIRSYDDLDAMPVRNQVASGQWINGAGYGRERTVYNCFFLFEGDWA